MDSAGGELEGLPGLPAVEAAPAFTVTVDPDFVGVAPAGAPELLPTLIGWHEVHIVWAESGEHVERLEHIPTGMVLLSPPFATDDDRHDALVALDEQVNMHFERADGIWVRSDE